MARLIFILSIIVYSLPITAQIQGKIEFEDGNGGIIYAPSLQSDGMKIIFQRKLSDQINYELVESFRTDDNKWSEPKVIRIIAGYGLDTDLIGGPSISHDGNTLYYFSAMGDNGSSDIYFSKRKNFGWGTPQTIGMPINTKGYEAFPSLSPDEQTLYFIGANEDGPRSPLLREQLNLCYSIYHSKRDANGNWQEPEKLPWPINQDCEKAPRILPDGKTLIFSSNRPGGKGDFDLYVSTINDNNEWSFPINLESINTDKSDQFVSVTSKGRMYYQSREFNKIYSAPVVKNIELQPTVTISGQVNDPNLNLGIESEILIESTYLKKASYKVSTAYDGSFSLFLPPRDSYKVTYLNENYRSISKQYDLKLSYKSEIRYDTISLQRSSYDNEQNEISKSIEYKINDPVEANYSASNKVALVIGVKSYTNVPPLKNTINDAKGVAQSLSTKGFDIIELYDPKSKSDIKNAVIEYYNKLNGTNGIGLFYYSGHGIQVDGYNYLVPTEATLSIKADAQEECMNLDYILRAMGEIDNSLNIVILDACRNNPFRGFSRSTDVGLNNVIAPQGSYIVYSTKPGSVASDGDGENGLFTSKLLKYLEIPNLSIEQVFKGVASEVSVDSDDKQRPWISSDYTGNFYFNIKDN